MQLALLPREMTPEAVLAELQRRRGAANGITARDLVYVITGRISSAEERKLRDVIVKLRLDGHPICAHPALGYHFAANATELNDACWFLAQRAHTSLRQAAAMNHVSMPDFCGQLGLIPPSTTEEPSE